jgi:hypothetical protein
MSNNNDKLVPTTPATSPLRVGMAGRLAAAKQSGGLTHELLDYSRYANRIVLCIDDSGSMSSSMSSPTDFPTEESYERSTDKYETRMSTCRKACEEFLNVCDSRDTALGMYTISTGRETHLTTAYPLLLADIRGLKASGGTPTMSTLDKIQANENVNRVVVVSDGESGALQYQTYDNEGTPNLSKFSQQAQVVVDKYKEKKIIIDTVFIGDAGSNGEREMKLLAEATGGLFLVFKSGESFRTKFKYLAPAFRGMLTSGQVKI